MRITRLLHVSVHVGTDLDASRAFFFDVLGLNGQPRPELAIPGAWFAVSDTEVHLNGRHLSVLDDTGSAPVHICFGVADLSEAIFALDAAGVPYEEAGSLEVRQIWLREPGGNVIEMQEDV